MTLEQIVNQIERFVVSHRQLKSFFEGDITEFSAGKFQDYPVLTCMLMPSTISEGLESFTFQFGVFDKLNSDQSNRLNVLSDTRQMCVDLIAYIRNNPELTTIDIALPITLDDFSGQMQDYLAGYFFTASLNQHQSLNYCYIPLSNTDAITTEDGFPITTEDGKILILE